MEKIFTIADLTEDDVPLFCSCLTPKDITEADEGGRKQTWYRQQTKEQFGVKLAKTETGIPIGMIQYLPISASPAHGENLWFIYCIWIPPKKRNPGGDWRKKGIGKALLNAAEKDVRDKGADGLAAWGTSLPFFMRTSWFKKQGYIKCDKIGIQDLVWKSFTATAKPPKWRKNPAPLPQMNNTKKAEIIFFTQGICPAMNTACERFIKAAEELSDDTELQIVDVGNSEAVNKWGQTDSVYINGKEFPLGPPPAYKKILKAIKREIKRK